jgi:hypothetical protein
MKNSVYATTVLDAVTQLDEAGVQFEQKEIKSVPFSQIRGSLMSQGLAALGHYYDVPLEKYMGIDSRGDIAITVDQKSDQACIVNLFNQSKVFGEAFSSLLNEHRPRTGDGSGANKMDENSCWCFLNHFEAEKMLRRGAELIRQEQSYSEGFQSGAQVVTVKGEVDTDEDGQERLTPPGSTGFLDTPSAPGQWAVHFGDAAVHITEDELRDESQYRLVDRPRGG